MRRTRLGSRGPLLALLAALAVSVALPAAADVLDVGPGDPQEAIDASQDAYPDEGADAAVLARSDEFADAGAGSPLADLLEGPLLLTEPDELLDPVADELERAVDEDGTVHLLGGEAALSEDVEEAVSDLGFAIERHGGADRFETAALIAQAVADARVFGIEDVDSRNHPDEVVIELTPPPELAGIDVPADAWTVVEDGEERPAELLATDADALTVMLAIDVSDAAIAEEGEEADLEPGTAALDAARDAALGFVGQLPDEVGVGVVTATGPGEAEVLQAPTDDRDALEDALDALEPATGSATYEAIDLSLAELADADVGTVVLLSDGDVQDAEPGQLGATQRAIEDAGVTLQAVQLLTDDANPRILEALASAGDGRRVPAGDPAALAPLYDDLAYELVGTQRLAYPSATEDEADLEVTVTHDDETYQTQETVSLEGVGSVLEPPPFSGALALWTGAGALFGGLALLVGLLVTPRERLRTLTPRERATETTSALSGAAERATALAERVLRRRGYQRGLNAALERAGLDLRPGEVIVLVASGMMAGLAVGALLGSWLLGGLLALIVPIVARVWISILGDRRRNAFREQLPDVLQLLAGSLRAGYGLPQAVDAVSRDAEDPAAAELRRVVVEARLGRDLVDALWSAADRVGDEDFRWVVQAIAINREVGGDLAAILDTITATVRDRAQIRRQVSALSAEGRLSGYVLLALPIGVAGFILVTNPDYLMTLVENPIGWVMIALGVVLMGIGTVWMRKVIAVEY